MDVGGCFYLNHVVMWRLQGDGGPTFQLFWCGGGERG